MILEAFHESIYIPTHIAWVSEIMDSLPYS